MDVHSLVSGFNGYEVSNDGYLRSMKHFRQFPMGILIKPVSRDPYGSSCDPLYELSNDNNKRVKIRLSQLMMLAANNQYAVSGYPRATIVTDTHSRNEKIFIKREIPLMDNTQHYAKFTVIQEGNEHMNMSYIGPQVKVPVSSIDGKEFYGRKDCRTLVLNTVTGEWENG